MFILQIVHSAQVGWNYINIIPTPLEVAKAKLRLSKAMEISLNILIYTSKENKKHAASFWGLTLSISNKIQCNSLPKKKKKNTHWKLWKCAVILWSLYLPELTFKTIKLTFISVT